MAEDRIRLPHRLTLDERQKLTVTGVSEVVSFDENSVVLTTDMGTLVILGSQLQLKTLSVEGGQVAVDGTVSSMSYEELRHSTGGWMRRLFG